LLAESFAEFSSGWWFKPANGSYKILKLITDLQELAPLDFKLLRFFAQHAKVAIFLFKKDGKQCEWALFSPQMEMPLAEHWAQHARPFLQRSRISAPPRPEQRDKARLDQAAEFLHARGLLQQAAISRIFANCWLGDQFILDVDFFVEYADTIYAFEIKQKFPFRRGRRFAFGLNKGEARLHVFLSQIGVRLINVILTKPVLHDKIPAIDLYTKNEYRRLSLWLAAAHSDAILQSPQRLAPSKTSIYTGAPVRFYEMPLSRFHLLKNFGEPKPQALLDFINGKTGPLPEDFVYPHR